MRVVEQRGGDPIEHRAVLADVTDDLFHLIGDRARLVLGAAKVQRSATALIEFDELGVEFIDLMRDVLADPVRIIGDPRRHPMQTRRDTGDRATGGDTVLAAQSSHVGDHRARLGGQETHVRRRR